MTEEQWVKQAQAGNTQAFSQLVLAYQQFVYTLCLRAVGSPQEAEDLAQEAFLRAWLALPRFRAQARFRTWLYRIVVNLCYNRLPRLRQEVEALPVEGEALDGSEWELPTPLEMALSPDQALEAQERRQFLHTEVERLPETQRMLILLRYSQDLSYDEIAEVMGLPLGTVKTGLFRAHQHLRLALAQYEETPVCPPSH